MGLNDSYVGIRGKILQMRPQPTLDFGYSMVLIEEQQRGISNIETSNTALVAHQL